MEKQPLDELRGTEPVTWDDVGELLQDLKATAHGLLRQEWNAGTVHTTQLLNDALKKLIPRKCDWQDVAWKDRTAFFKDAFFAMRRMLIDYARRRKVRAEVKVGGFEDEHIAPLTEARLLNFDRLIDRAGERAELAQAVDEALSELEATYPGQELASIVQHRIFNGLAQKEIAQMLGVTDKTIYNRIQLAYAFLRLKLGTFFTE